MSSLKRAWSRRRREVIDRDGRRCTECGAAGALEVHHEVGSLRRDFRRGEISPAEVLTTLCSNCHNDEHRRLRPQDPDRLKWRAYVRKLEGTA